ncbi:hypothetical protein [Streptomyces noursei]|uniref:hypothetical protein n=1 Tax=Streptomyces noursei TaxID=1971 RepID=UPI00167AA308|nr:hypothetical protein [Streptomyces noursei]MCZ1019844.1 hypothetical protein [Streptomyces noursei]GGX36287.1 hypothetical protein GCM10010341_67160 [Streptomyces noursei]
MDDWKPPRLYLPDEHLPRTGKDPWTCRSCAVPWPCPIADPYLTGSRCQCGAPSYWEVRGRRHWHIGPICYTRADVLAAYAKERHEYHQAHPHYPPQRPPQPRRRRRQRPRYKHTPSGPGDVLPGTWLWVKPGGLHPAWGDLHRLAMLTHVGRPYCEVWLDDTTVHRVKGELLILERRSTAANVSEAGGVPMTVGRGPRPRPLLPEWRWLKWTVAEHLAFLEGDCAPAGPASVQEELFPVRQA